MKSNRFRPTVYELEGREVPSVTPSEVFAAVDQINANADVLEWLSQNLDTKSVFLRRAQLATQLPVLSRATGDAANTLARYIVDSQEVIANGNGNAAVANYIAKANEMIAKGEATEAYAASLALNFGASANDLLPPAPPAPPPPPAVTPVFDDSQLANSIPTDLSTGFQDIGSGLLVKDVVVGVGDAEAETGQDVTVDYTGWLASDGTQFDSSRTRGEPATFSLNQVIVGWQRGIPGMKAGGIRQLVIPAALAYGTTGSPPSIPANADLVFEVRMRSVSDATASESSIF